jgi:hypothetical protein
MIGAENRKPRTKRGLSQGIDTAGKQLSERISGQLGGVFADLIRLQQSRWGILKQR